VPDRTTEKVIGPEFGDVLRLVLRTQPFSVTCRANINKPARQN